MMTVGGWIEMGATLGVQGLEFYSGFDEDYPRLRAEALYVAGRTREALETIEKAKALCTPHRGMLFPRLRALDR